MCESSFFLYVYTVSCVCLRLREIPAELLRFPVRAMKAKVAGFKPPKIRPDGPVLSYAPQWSFKALESLLESLHGKVTASVVVSIHIFSMVVDVMLLQNVNECYSL